MLENIAVIALVVLAGAYLARRFLRKGGCGCASSGGAGGCGSTGAGSGCCGGSGHGLKPMGECGCRK